MNKTFEITNEILPLFFLTPEQVKQAEEMSKKEEVELYWIRRDHVMLDVLSDQAYQGDSDEE